MFASLRLPLRLCVEGRFRTYHYYPKIPSFFPTFRNTSSARSSSALVCVDATIVRTRALPFGHRGKPDARRQHAFIEQLARQLVRQRGLADNHRRDRRLADARVEPGGTQARLEVARVVPKLLDALGLLLQHIESGQARRGHGRRMRRRKQERARAMVQELDQVAAPAHVPAQHADRLRERPHLNVYAPMQAEMIDRPAPVAPQHARGMRVVHHHDRAVPFGRLGQPGQRADIAVHREHAVGDQQLAPGHRIQLAQDLLRRGHILVREHVDLGPRQPAAVDDAGVVQLVADDVVFRRQDRRHRARVGREARLEHHARFHVLERRDALLELHVHAHGAGDGAHRAATHAEFADRFQRRFAQFGMRRQPEVVVGGEVDHLFAVEARFRRALRFQDAQPLVGALGAPLFQLIVKIRERIRHECLLDRRSAPALPLSVQIPVSAGEVQQRLALADLCMHHLADQNVVIAHRHDPVDGALDRRQHARNQRHPGDAGLPLQAVEAVVAFARKTVRQRPAGLPPRC